MGHKKLPLPPPKWAAHWEKEEGGAGGVGHTPLHTHRGRGTGHSPPPPDSGGEGAGGCT